MPPGSAPTCSTFWLLSGEKSGKIQQRRGAPLFGARGHWGCLEVYTLANFCLGVLSFFWNARAARRFSRFYWGAETKTKTTPWGKGHFSQLFSGTNSFSIFFWWLLKTRDGPSRKNWVPFFSRVTGQLGFGWDSSVQRSNHKYLQRQS